MDVDVVFQSPEVLDVHSVVAGPVSGGLVGHAELCDEPWVTRALTLKQTPVSVPLHNLPIILIITITINVIITCSSMAERNLPYLPASFSVQQVTVYVMSQKIRS